MVEGERQPHSVIENILTVDRLYPARDRSYAEDTGLRRIDNGSKALDAHRAEICDGERAAAQLVGRYRTCLSTGNERLGLSRKLVERERISRENGVISGIFLYTAFQAYPVSAGSMTTSP